MFRAQSRRKFTNVIVDPKALLRFSIPFFALVIISVTTIMTIHWQILSAFTSVENATNYDPATALSMSEAITRITMTGMIGMFILGIVCMLFWIIYSHRIFGPTVPIRDHITKLISGDYQSRIQLRARDEFKDVARDLNALAEKLSGATKT